MASAALPEWATDIPGDITGFFNHLAKIQEHKGGESFWKTLCCDEHEYVERRTNQSMWQDQRIVSRNRLPSHVPLRCFENAAAAAARTLADVVPTSKWVLPLTPAKWAFKLSPCPRSAPKPNIENEKRGFDTSESGWGDIDVPLSWEIAGHSHAIYLNTLYPFPIHPPFVPRFDNPVGCYQRSFDVPADWEGRAVVLHLDGIGSACIVWVDGLPIGYSQDGKLACEFDVTGALLSAAVGSKGTMAGSHTISVQVLRWSDGSYLECQDTWRLSGIQRHCWLYSKDAALAVCDYHVATDVNVADGSATLSVEVRLDGAIAAAAVATAAVSDAAAADGSAAATALGQAKVRASLLGPFVMEAYDTPPPARPVVWTAEATPTVRAASAAADADGALLSGDVEAVFRGALQSAALWCAEAPNLHTLLIEVEVAGEGGARVVVGTEACWVGVRSIAVEDGLMRLNGKRLTIYGANVTEFDPDGGRALSWQTMVMDGETLKRHNLNAVRLAHCPFPEAWYDVCDALGLYVVDEANIETHGTLFLGDEGLMANWVSWRHAYFERFTRMVQRDKNRSCVLWWSLGNESGYGDTHDEMANWARKHNPRRLVFYESCGAGAATDVLCPMYYADFLVAKMDTLEGQLILDFSPTRRFPDAHPPGVGMRPVILSEWTHAMGNATGDYADWWRLFRSMKHVQGGFIWAWADEAIKKQAPSGEEHWGYGGDFGEKCHNYTFCLNGLVFPDRTPHPALYEVKHVNQPIACALRSSSWEVEGEAVLLAAVLEVSSRFDCLRLGELVAAVTVTATLELDGKPCGAATLDQTTVDAIAPGATAAIELRVRLDGAATASAVDASVVRLTVRSKTSAALLWAAAGHELAYDQFALPYPEAATLAKVTSTAPLPPPAVGAAEAAAPPLKVEETAGGFAVSGGGARGAFSVIISKADGQLRDLSLNGVVVLQSGGGLNLYRPPCDGDLGTLMRPGLQTVPPSAGRNAQKRTFLRLIGPESGAFAFLYKRRLLPTILSYADTWEDAGLHALKPRLTRLARLDAACTDACAVFEVIVRFAPKDKRTVRATLTQRIEVTYGAVEILSTCVLAPKTYAKLPSLARVGLTFSLPTTLEHARWLGRGPHENYVDRCDGAMVGIYESAVAGLHVPYIFPQENGHRTETRWLELQGADGSGVRVSAGVPSGINGSAGVDGGRGGTFGFNASRYTTAALAAAKHTCDLKRASSVELCVDHAMMGVGGDSAAIQSVRPEYTLKPEGGKATWALTLTPFVAVQKL